MDQTQLRNMSEKKLSSIAIMLDYYIRQGEWKASNGRCSGSLQKDSLHCNAFDITYNIYVMIKIYWAAMLELKWQQWSSHRMGIQIWLELLHLITPLYCGCLTILAVLMHVWSKHSWDGRRTDCRSLPKSRFRTRTAMKLRLINWLFEDLRFLQHLNSCILEVSRCVVVVEHFYT